MEDRVEQQRVVEVKLQQARFEASLSSAEASRAARFRLGADRKRFIVGRGLVRALIGAELGMKPAEVPIALNPAGRPVVQPDEPGGHAARVQFSVSHSGEWVLVALSRMHLVGVDVEILRDSTDFPELARTAFAPAEYLAAPPQDVIIQRGESASLLLDIVEPSPHAVAFNFGFE